MASVRPLHDPTPVPDAMDPGVLDVPVTVKSACVHAGLVLSAWAEKARTAAVTAVT